MRAMSTAATAMSAMETNVAVIANNIANVRTTGFKKARPEFQDLLYQNERAPGTVTSKSGTRQPSGIQIGMGVRTAATYRIMSQGTLNQTQKPLDLAIRGEGFFIIKMPDGTDGYTRDGSFEVDSSGKIVTIDGYSVQPGITIPQSARDINISSEGYVQAKLGNENDIKILGQLQLAIFVNSAGLESQGSNLYKVTASSGLPQVAFPANGGYGSLIQGYVEQSNVNAINEITDLIQAQRAYEMNSKVINTGDEMLKATSNIK